MRFFADGTKRGRNGSRRDGLADGGDSVTLRCANVEIFNAETRRDKRLAASKLYEVARPTARGVLSVDEIFNARAFSTWRRRQPLVLNFEELKASLHV